MHQEAMYHKSDSQYCFALDEHTVALRLRVYRGDTPEQVCVLYGMKYDFMNQRQAAAMELSFTDDLYDYYTARLELKDVRLVYIFQIVEDGRIYYYSEDGLTQSYDFPNCHFNVFQLPYINVADIQPVVAWTQGAVFYQIFIDRFYRGDFKKDDKYINLDWGGIPDPKSFAGGDLPGIIAKLPYLAQLGITALYLTPIFRSPSNHKYDICDYYMVDRQFGTSDDLKMLVKEAHGRNIRVVLDAVFNHCSEGIAQFEDVKRYGAQSQFHSWFIIDGDKPNPENPNYECFAACSYMPKLNTSNEAVQTFLLDVATYWIREYDIDGWRLDVSDEVSHDFWRKFRVAVKGVKQDCLIVGENWHDAYPYLMGDQYDCIMNYAFTKACLDYFVNKTIDAGGMAGRLCKLLMRNTDMVNAMMVNLLDSHDTHRFLTLADGNTDTLLAALAVMFMYTGVPQIYYGTEIFMEGGYDPDCRRTFDWFKTPTEQIAALIALKKTAALQSNDLRMSAECGVLVMRKGETVLYHNASYEPVDVPKNMHILWGNSYDSGRIMPNGVIICGNMSAQ